MKPIMFIGLVFIILGVVVLLLQLITFTTHVKGIHISTFKTSAEAKTDFPVPPLFGVLVLAGGIVLVIIGRKRKPLFNQHRLTTVFGRLKHKQSHSGWECWRFLKSSPGLCEMLAQRGEDTYTCLLQLEK